MADTETAKEILIAVETAKHLRHTTTLIRVISCDHTWEGHGLGFHCLRCGYYTGVNMVLNNAITREGKTVQVS